MFDRQGELRGSTAYYPSAVTSNRIAAGVGKEAGTAVQGLFGVTLRNREMQREGSCLAMNVFRMSLYLI